MSPRCLLLACALVLATASPAAADAANGVASLDAHPVRGPVVARDNILWTEQDGRGYDLWLSGDNKEPVDLARIFSDDGDRSNSAGSLVAGGPDTFALGVSSTSSKTSVFKDTIYGGPIESEFDALVSASGDGASCDQISTDDFDIDGSAIVYSNDAQPNCTPRRETARLRTGPGQETTLDAGEATAVDSTRIAGPYVAWRQSVASGAEVVVWDRRVNQAVLHLAGAPERIDVDAAGHLVTVTNGVPTWRTIGTDAVHTLPLTGVTKIALADGRLGYQSGAEIGTIALADGATPVPVATIPSGLPVQWDFDGRRIAWLDETCTATPIRTELAPTVRGPGDDAAGPPVSGCPVTIATATAVVARKTGKLSIKLTCPLGCTARVSLALPKVYKGTRRASVAVASGKSRNVTFTLKPAEVRKLKRLRAAAGTVTARSQLLGGGMSYSRSLKVELG